MAIRETYALFRERKAFSELSQLVADASGQQEGQEKDDRETGMLAQYRKLYEGNEEFFGWISIEGTAIDYPVMYSPKRPDHYLHRAFDGSYSFSGVPFIDSRCPYDGNYYLIYAHHMKNGTMFGQLTDYRDEAFCREHQLIRFDTLYEQREYVILSAFMTEAGTEGVQDEFRFYRQITLNDPGSFDAFVKQVRAASLYDRGIDASFGDELIALSTCSDHESNGRFVVVAKRIR